MMRHFYFHLLQGIVLKSHTILVDHICNDIAAFIGKSFFRVLVIRQSTGGTDRHKKTTPHFAKILRQKVVWQF
jgi:hypothetical protein